MPDYDKITAHEFVQWLKGYLEAIDATNITYKQYEISREKEEFWESFYIEVKSWDTGALKANEYKVLQAIRILFESSEDIEIFNKKAVYLYMREITGLNTKQIVNSLNKMRVKYRDFKKKWNKGEI